MKYGYLHNLQGDIIGIVDQTGLTVVEYTYDAWGKPLNKTGTLASTLGAINPFRYRGYVYDEETGLYYLRSRYYNPGLGRFVNADSLFGNLGGLLSHNMFAYCINDPIDMSDSTGQSPSLDYSIVRQLSQADMIKLNNGLTKSGKVSRKATKGAGLIYIPALGEAPLWATWNSIGEHHFDIRFPFKKDKERIMAYFGFSMENKGTLKEWAKRGARDPVEAYLEFQGITVAGSVNLLLHSGSGKGAKLNVNSGNICFYTYDSKTSSNVISKLVQGHRDVAQNAYDIALGMSINQYLVIDD